MSALTMYWNADWPLPNLLSHAAEARLPWPYSVVELVTQN